MGILIIVTTCAIVLVFHKTDPLPTTPGLPVAEFGGVHLKVEYAISKEEREKGLSGRTNIPDDQVMLFIFPKDDLYGFWMKDMLMPIDIFWLSDQGHVVSIDQNAATSSYPNVFYPDKPVKYVLETAAGFAQEHNIIKGTPFLLKNLPIVSK